MPKDIKRYSYSRLDAFKTCPKKHHYLYVEQLPEPENEYALKGTLFHKAIEKILKGEDIDPVYKEWEEAVDLGKIYADRDQLEYSVNMYFSHYYHDYQKENTLAVEQEFTRDLENDDYFVGRVDQVYEKNEIVVIRDTKTSSGPLKYDHDKVKTNTQLLSYVEPIENILNRTVNAIEIDEVRLAKLDTEVPLIKNGKPSKSLDVLSLTTAELYRNELEKQNLIEDSGYANVLYLLEQRGHPLFNRTIVQLSNRNILDTTNKEINSMYLGASLDIEYRIKDQAKCFRCTFKNICEHDEYGIGNMLREKMINN